MVVNILHQTDRNIGGISELNNVSQLVCAITRPMIQGYGSQAVDINHKGFITAAGLNRQGVVNGFFGNNALQVPEQGQG